MVALPISIQEIRGLKACVDGKVKEIALSNLEEIFQKKLERYGAVTVPSPFLAQAHILAEKNNIELKAIDMNEVVFTDFYTKSVSLTDLVIHSQRVRRVKSKTFKARTGRDFIIEWDNYINRTTGIHIVEQQREIVMAANLLKMPKKHKRVLAFIEAERLPGVEKHIKNVLSSK